MLSYDVLLKSGAALGHCAGDGIIGIGEASDRQRTSKSHVESLRPTNRARHGSIRCPFVELVDRPPAGIADQVADAKARLARLISKGG
jgi:hypothetical protein